MVSGDTSLPLERCSTIDTYSMSILMVSSELSEGGLEQVTIFKVLEEHGELGPLYTMSAAIEVVAGGGEGVWDAIELSGEPGSLLIEFAVLKYFCHSGRVVEVAGFFGKGVETSILTGEEGNEPQSCCLSGSLSIVRLEEKLYNIGGFPRLPPSQ
jgi:hypothetical protein